MNDHRVDAYIEQQEHAAEESIVKLPYLKQDYYRQQLLELFNFRDLMLAEEALNRAAIEWLHAYPKLQMLHKATLQSMQTQEVAEIYRATVFRSLARRGICRAHAEKCRLLHRAAQYLFASAFGTDERGKSGK